MTKSKLLVTGGCSFSSPRGMKEKKTWVEYFQEKYDYKFYYHSGLGVNPVVNDIVYDRSSSGEYFEFNGGYLWYLTDAGEAIRIDSTGRIVDVSICGVTKTTEAGDDKTTENDLDKTIE